MKLFEDEDDRKKYSKFDGQILGICLRPLKNDRTLKKTEVFLNNSQSRTKLIFYELNLPIFEIESKKGEH